MIISGRYWNTSGLFRCTRGPWGGWETLIREKGKPVLVWLPYEYCTNQSEDEGVNAQLVRHHLRGLSRFSKAPGVWARPYLAALEIQEEVQPLDANFSSFVEGRMFGNFAQYRGAFAQVQELLHAGICYQINLCDRWRIRVVNQSASPEALFWSWYHRTQARYAAWLPGVPSFRGHQGSFEKNFFCFSPELFFAVSFVTEGEKVAYPKNRLITVSPIKGTISKGIKMEGQDAHQVMMADRKITSELWMITDLMRNDLAKLAVKGSVNTSQALGLCETPYVSHLQSVTEAQLQDGVEFSRIMGALAPSGSVTGAPKGCSIEAIRHLEPWPRGPYTGVLGVIQPSGEAVFSVVIRSLLEDDDSSYVLGVGGGVVAGSSAWDEWQEIAAKGRPFVDS